MTSVFVGIGSNLESPLQQVKKAIAAMADIPQTELKQISSFYRSAPMGPQDQPDFIDVVVRLDTMLSAEVLLDHLQVIEQRQGRVRTAERWGPRIIDCDILLYGNEIIHTKRLTVPHYGLKERAFYLYPLAELVADLVLPTGEHIQDLLLQCPKTQLLRISESN